MGDAHFIADVLAAGEVAAVAVSYGDASDSCLRQNVLVGVRKNAYDVPERRGETKPAPD